MDLTRVTAKTLVNITDEYMGSQPVIYNPTVGLVLSAWGAV